MLLCIKGENDLKYDGVFEGGGVKGIAFVGALTYLEEKGYVVEKVAGTSAGAIIAALLAAGYTTKELKEIMLSVNFELFADKSLMQSIPIIGEGLGILINKSICLGDAFENWMSKLLITKGKKTFSDIGYDKESRLKIVASDVTRRKMIILPEDIAEYGIEPKNLEIAKAVRMSMSIPFYFKPIIIEYKNNTNYIVDGGLLSNYPIWMFDVKTIPRWPSFGFKLLEPSTRKKSIFKNSTVAYLIDVISTALETNDEAYIRNEDNVRTIGIPTLGVETTEFNISKERKLELFQSGYDSAKIFIEKWNFERYKNKYRMGNQ